ncbi:MAG: thioredoxin family protein [Deltaproteobacteria bacterium]|nr:thioredoxin family protein [Deltaproteobacteria bacterium]
MKKCLPFLLVLLLASCAGSKKTEDSKLNWLMSWDEAASVATKESRQMIAEFSTEWCPYCKFIDEKIFTDGEVGDKLSKFVLLRLDGDKASSQTYMDKFDVKGFPTFIIFDEKGAELKRFNDLNDKGDLLAILENTASDETKLSENIDSIEIAKLLISKFPHSPFLPVYYKKLADFYASATVKNSYLKAAKGIIETALNHFSTLDLRTQRIAADQYVDLLAEILKELEEYQGIKGVYSKGAALSKEIVQKNGGIENNRYLIGNIVYYYLKVGELKHAKDFLIAAEKANPSYWPVYSNFAKVYKALGETDEAVKYCKKGYELAEEVARPRIALIWAEVLADAKKYKEAVDVLKSAEDDLIKTGSSDKGRAKKLSEQLKKSRIEMESFL